MTISPVTFAKSFARMQNACRAKSDKCNRIVYLIRFWPSMEDILEHPSYKSYGDQYVDMLTDAITDDCLKELLLPELVKLRSILEILGHSFENTRPHGDLIEEITIQTIALYLYVGKIDEALSELQSISKENLTSDKIGEKAFDEYDYLSSLFSSIKDNYPISYNYLRQIQAERDNYRNNFYADRIYCLFAERSASGNPTRGRLAQLTGSIRLRREFEENSDTIAFDNEIKTPDDPFVGVIYSVLKAVRLVLHQVNKTAAAYAYDAHYSILNATNKFAGDSIGLAAALTAYVQLLSPDVERSEKFLSANVAVTGSINESGQILAVNNESLKKKIERVFFSPIKYLVIPRENYDKAIELVKKMREEFPRRRLRLIAAGNLWDVIDDRNVMREERMCFGEFISKKVKSYTTKTKVHMAASALIVLLVAHFIAVQFEPKLSPWFDYRIADIETQDDFLIAYNSAQNEIFRTRKYPQPLIASKYSDAYDPPKPSWYKFVDFDSDGKDELAIMPHSKGMGFFNAEIYYDVNTIYSLPICVDADYLPDSNLGQYDFRGMSIITDTIGNKYIMIEASASGPARHQFNLYDCVGNHIGGPYINQGNMWGKSAIIKDLDGDGKMEFIIGAVNNYYNRCALIVLNPFDLSGVSPSYDSPNFQHSRLPKGSHLIYATFPETPLSIETGAHSIPIQINYDSSSGIWEVYVKEGMGFPLRIRPELIYQLNKDFIPIMPPVFADGDYKAYVDAMIENGIKTTMSEIELCRKLFNDVIVYRSNDVIYPTTK